MLFSLELQAQKTINFSDKNISGTIFTKDFFKNNKESFTPKIEDIKKIEKLLYDTKNFSNYYRQYIGIKVIKKEIIVQLIPKNRVKFYKNWQTKYILIKDDIEVRYAYYDLDSKKIVIKPKDSLGG